MLCWALDELWPYGVIAGPTVSFTRVELEHGTPTLGLYQPKALCAVAPHLLPD